MPSDFRPHSISDRHDAAREAESDALPRQASTRPTANTEQTAPGDIVRATDESERQRHVYETVLNSTPDFVYVFGLDHRVRYANDALIRMWGRGHDGAIGKTFLEIGYEPWHAAMHDREIDEVRATRQPIRGEVPFTGTNGRREYEYIFVPVIGADGEVEAVAGTTRDVTERKETEMQLRDGQEQLDFALTAAELGQWSLSLSDHQVRRTLRHDQIFGYDALLPVWTFELFLEHVLPADREAVTTGFQRSIDTGSAWEVECRIRRADGGVRDIWMKGLVRRDASGQVARMLGIIADITDRRQAEAQQAFYIRLADTLRPLSDPVQVKAEASRVLGEHLGANRVVYFEIRDDNYVIERDYTAGVRSIAGRYPVASFGPAVRAALLAGRTIIEADATTHPDRPSVEREAFGAIDVRGHVDVPLVKGGRFVAGMTVQVCSRRDWSQHEVALIEETAQRTWAAVERVRAEVALRQSEERSAFVRRSSGVGFWYCDLPFDVLEWDDLVKAHFHLPPDAVVTIQTFYDRMHPDDRERIRCAIDRSIADRTPYQVDYRTVHAETGAITWVRAIGRTLYAADGSPKQFDGVTLDVSDQKRVEASLRESEERRRLALDAAELGAWNIDPTTNTLTTDERFRQIFAGTTNEIDYEQAFAAIHQDDRARVRAAVAAAIRADDPLPYAEEYRVVHADGTVRWVFAKGRANRDLANASRRLISFNGTVSDVTDRKRIEEEREGLVRQLRDQDRRKDEFLATLSHELRNPLAPLRNGLQVIRMAEPGGMIEKTRSMMERQVTQLVRLVDDLLDVSRVTSDKLELRRETLALQDVLDAAMETCRPIIDEAGHAITLDMPYEPIWVNGDMTRLAQVVSNLLNNSAKYTPRGGHIRLTLGRDGDMATVSVADDGIGIPRAMLDTVFDMFAQVDRALEKTTGGLGIGLSLVKGLVERHGGSVEARSDGEGRGSEFVVRLPVLSSAARDVARDADDHAVQSPERRRILIADDNVDAADAPG
ncbi:MAG: PAS domain-containing protein [Gemmatimonadaceae bacterium]|nr:PAS domain-containing protein [Gemmatimonadaceae bacterium]